ncbi:TraB/GumN family protein [Cyclobacterium plantarum]|uniref:TraB/GumN family protein n=1 Tax=Cyclobacterium plantarum TaxID=2716263 RepID=UPI003F71F764
MEQIIKRILYFLFPLVWLTLQVGLVQGQTRINSGPVNTILFKVTTSESNNVSYLFGTHHAFGKEFFDALTNAGKALSSGEVLIKENLSIPGHTAEDIINARTGSTSWEKYLGKEDLTYIEDLFADSPTDFNKITPTEMHVFLNRHFKQQICLNKAPEDISLSLDDYIASKAVEQDIKLYGLETTTEQIALINKDVEGMPRKIHKRRLSIIIEKIRARHTSDCEETDWYAQMEIDYQLQAPCTNALMLTDRNEKWMETIVELLSKKNCFIAVGLSHLMYECGLINQLTALGYTITPMEAK